MPCMKATRWKKFDGPIGAELVRMTLGRIPPSIRICGGVVFLSLPFQEDPMFRIPLIDLLTDEIDAPERAGDKTRQNIIAKMNADWLRRLADQVEAHPDRKPRRRRRRRKKKKADR